MKDLLIDIGNSYIKFAHFEKNIWSEKKSIALSEFETIDFEKADRAYFSSVSLDNAIVIKKLEKTIDKDRIYLLDSSSLLPFKSMYENIQNLGNDRKANLAGAVDLLKNQNCLIFSFGTCITYDIMTENNLHLGGNISPGLQMRLKAMHEYTSKLPFVEPEWHTDLGKNTEMALQNGAVWGIKMEIEKLILDFNNKFDKINVLFTGGDASFFEKLIDIKIFALPNLTLLGLKKLLELNANKNCF